MVTLLSTHPTIDSAYLLIVSLDVTEWVENHRSPHLAAALDTVSRPSNRLSPRDPVHNIAKVVKVQTHRESFGFHPAVRYLASPQQTLARYGWVEQTPEGKNSVVADNPRPYGLDDRFYGVLL